MESMKPFHNRPCPKCGKPLQYKGGGIWCDCFYDEYECEEGHLFVDYGWLGKHELREICKLKKEVNNED